MHFNLFSGFFFFEGAALEDAELARFGLRVFYRAWAVFKSRSCAFGDFRSLDVVNVCTAERLFERNRKGNRRDHV